MYIVCQQVSEFWNQKTIYKLRTIHASAGFSFMKVNSQCGEQRMWKVKLSAVVSEENVFTLIFCIHVS